MSNHRESLSGTDDRGKTPTVVVDGGTTRSAKARDVAFEAGELHRLLVESVRDYAIFALDPHGCILSWNAGAQRIKGYTAEEIIGKHFSIFYPPERVAEHFPDFELASAAKDGRFEDEGWRLRRDGSRFWANVVITALRDATGTLVGFAKVTRDLTERRAAEARHLEDARSMASEEAARHAADAARDRTERLQRLTAALAAAFTIPDILRVIFFDGFRDLDVDAGVLVRVRDQDQKIELLGCSGLAHPPSWINEQPIAAATPVTEAIRTGGVVVSRSRLERDARFPLVARDLADYNVAIVVPMKTRGANQAALAMYRRSDAEVSHEELSLIEAFGQQCGQALERAELYEAESRARVEAEEARRRADEANHAKTAFLAAMSHELRTPLNAIGGYADLLAMEVSGPLTADQRAHVERMRRSQQHLLGIINDLLNFSRIEAGQIEYHFTIVSAADIMESVRHMIAPQAAAKGLNFSVEDCPRDVVVWVDRPKSEQILLNLLSNAVKFTERGRAVTMRCIDQGGTVTIVVEDQGTGIPADHLDRIFEPFVQVGRSLSTNREGTGLGLAISRDLARAMGGDITVSSTVGTGSTFRLSLRKTALPQNS
jgi:PAS domain S-box-containing protein